MCSTKGHLGLHLHLSRLRLRLRPRPRLPAGRARGQTVFAKLAIRVAFAR